MIIDIVHQKGGVGKSTIAVNIATELEAAILDLDSQQSSLLFNKLRKINGKKELLCHATSDPEEALQICLEYKKENKNLVIDSGGFDNQAIRFAMGASDLLITPVSPSQIEIFGLQKFAKILDEASNKIKHPVTTHVLINNVDSRNKAGIADLQEYVSSKQEHFKLLNTVIHSRSDYKKSYALGLSVIEFDAKSKASAELTHLINEIKNL